MRFSIFTALAAGLAAGAVSWGAAAHDSGAGFHAHTEDGPALLAQDVTPEAPEDEDTAQDDMTPEAQDDMTPEAQDDMVQDIVPQDDQAVGQGVMKDAPKTSRGVTSNFTLGTVDLGEEFADSRGLVLRAREIRVEPGGEIAVHQHDGRPSAVYILEGRVTEYRSGGATVWRAGNAVFERSGMTHYWRNETGSFVRALAVDVTQPKAAAAALTPREVVPGVEKVAGRGRMEDGPKTSKGVSGNFTLGTIELDGHFTDPSGLILRAREVRVAPGGAVAVHSHIKRTGLVYILEGRATEYRSGGTTVWRPGNAIFETRDVTHYWANETDEEVMAVAIDVVKTE